MVVLSHDKLNRMKVLERVNPSSDQPQSREDDRGFLELQACIPHLAESRRVSRLDILLEAINYIDILHTTLLDKIQRGDMTGEERRKLISSYLRDIVADTNKEN